MTRPFNQRPQLYRPANITRDPQIRSLYESGVSPNAIAARLSMSSLTVRRRLVAMGVKMRTITEGVQVHKRKKARRELIAAAAIKAFGHLHAPIQMRPMALPPVNDFDDVDFADFDELSSVFA